MLKTFMMLAVRFFRPFPFLIKKLYAFKPEINVFAKAAPGA